MSGINDGIEMINGLAGEYAPRVIFSDWVRCAALSMACMCPWQPSDVLRARSKDYTDTLHRYKDPDMERQFALLTAWLVNELESEITDVLGELYMKLDAGSKLGGQFFTPFHLSVLNAMLALDVDPGKPVFLNEPTCGSGGQVIAAAKVLMDAGINYQTRMRVIAQDLDWNCVYMTYLQLSLLGIRAVCIQCNTLADDQNVPESHKLYTPMTGFLI